MKRSTVSFEVKTSLTVHCFAQGSVYECSPKHSTQCHYTVLMHWKDFIGLKYKSVLTAHHEELQENTEQKQRQVHTDGDADADAETDTSTGADQTERNSASGTLIPHLGKDHLCILRFPSSYFRLHGHNVAGTIYNWSFLNQTCERLFWVWFRISTNAYVTCNLRHIAD